jgi:hypothetical protein
MITDKKINVRLRGCDYCPQKFPHFHTTGDPKVVRYYTRRGLCGTPLPEAGNCNFKRNHEGICGAFRCREGWVVHP